MPNGIDVGSAEPMIQQAEADARQALGSAGDAPLPPQFAPAPPLKRNLPSAPARKPAPSPLTSAPPPELAAPPDISAGGPSNANYNPELADQPAPPPAAAEPPEDNGDYWNSKTFMHFVRDHVKGTGQEVADIAPRLGAYMGVLFGRGAAGVATIGDTEIDALNDAWGAVTGGKTTHLRDQDSRLADASFDFVNKVLKPAVEYWTPQRAANTGQDEGSGGLAQAIGEGGEAAPYMAMGHLGIVPMLANASTQSMYDAIDRGEDVKTAFASGTIDGISNYIQAKYGVIPTKNLMWRVLTAMPLGDLMKVTGDYAKKIALYAIGNPEAAKKIDPTAGLAEATVQNAIFGALSKPKPKADAKTPVPTEAPAPELTAAQPAAPAGPAAGDNVQPPPPPAQATPQSSVVKNVVLKDAVTADGPTPTPFKIVQRADGNAFAQHPDGSIIDLSSLVKSGMTPEKALALQAGHSQDEAQVEEQKNVADKPTPEPAVNLRAQFNDMRDKDTPRTGVFVATDNRATLAGAKDANAAAVLNQLNQATKQGRTIDLPTGTLVLKTVALKNAAEADLKSGKDPQDVIGLHTGAGSGKTPDMTAVVQGQTPSGAVATETAVAPEDVPIAVQKAQDQGKTPVVTTPEAATAARIDGISKERNTPTLMGVMTTPTGKEIPVHVEPGAPEGQMRVRALDSDGEPSDHTVDVPADRVKVSKSGEGDIEPQASTPATTRTEEAARQPSTTVAAPEAAKAGKIEEAPTGLDAKGKPVSEQAPASDAEKAATRPTEDTSRSAGKGGAKNNLDISGAMKSDVPNGYTKDLRDKMFAAYQAGHDKPIGGIRDPIVTKALRSPGMDREQFEKFVDDYYKAKPVAEAPVPKPKAKPIKSALDSLPEALETHLAQEQIPEGKKHAAPLAERQDNASSFAAVLKAAADSARGKASASDIERAIAAAKRAEGLTNLSKASTAKGQGTGHTWITALNAEMHKAARALIGDAKPGDEVKVEAETAVQQSKVAKLKTKAKVSSAGADAPDERTQKAAKAEALKAKAAEKAAKAKAKADAEAAKDQVPVNPKYAGDIKKPKAAEPTVSVEDQRKAARLSEKYIWAENGDDEKAARLEIEQFLHEKFPDHKDAALQLLDQRRVEENPDSVRNKRMSETLEPEEVRLDAKDKYEGMERVDRPSLPETKSTISDKLKFIKERVLNNVMKSEWGVVASRSQDLLTQLARRVDRGDHIGTHDLLNQLIENTAPNSKLRGILSNLREHAPDLPIYMVSKVRSLEKNTEYQHAAGLFSPDHEAIQASFTNSPEFTLRTLVHEIRHAATEYELRDNPNGALATEAKQARAILIKRLAAKYGESTIYDHLAYFKDQRSVPKPANYMRSLYGIKDISEMHAELDNPDFIREIAMSEQHAQPGENLPKGSGGLLQRIYESIGRFFGTGEPKLLRHIADLHERTMATQASESYRGGRYDFLHGRTNNDIARELNQNLQDRFGANPLEARKAEEPLMALHDEEPPRLRGVDDDVHSLVDDEGTKVARAFKFATKSRAIDAIRSIVPKLKTLQQIFVDHRSDFGHPDDKNNPLNQMQDIDGQKVAVQRKFHDITRPVAQAWLKLSNEESEKIGQLMIDTTSYHIDPRKDFANQAAEVADDKDSEARHAEYQARYNALSPEAREVFNGAAEANKRIAKEERKNAIDAALKTFADGEISDAQRSLLYGAKTVGDYEALIGKDKLIDLGDRNQPLKDALNSFGGRNETGEPYFHLGRNGDYVVHATPEGTKEFDTKEEAQAFADKVNNLSPGSKGTYEERGGKHVVDYKADYTSFHESKNEAEAAAREMEAQGFEIGNVTRKTLGENAPLGPGAQTLLAEAKRKIDKMGDGKADEGSKAMVEALQSAFLQVAASRSAYAGSRLARKAAAGVKASEMRKNFSDYAQSTAWHSSQLATAFDQAAALARLRGMARERTGVDQKTAYRRGEVVDAINRHLLSDVRDYGSKSLFNQRVAQLGFMSYLASPSHAMIWMTQNYTTGIPVAGARWGYGKASNSFQAAMNTVIGPALRATIHNVLAKGGNAHAVEAAILAHISKDPRFGKWAKGDGSHFQKLMDMGVIDHAYANELAALAKDSNATVSRVFEFARLLPNMADSFNRVSTALAGLELTGGDVRKTADFVREIHADYSAQNKPLIFKALNRVPLGNSLTMFKTYTQAMAHLLYGNIKAAIGGSGKLLAGSKEEGLANKTWEAAKTTAGLIVGTSIFTGLYGAAAIEPLRLAVYAYHKIFDEEGEVYDLKNSMHHWLVDHLGDKAGELAASGLPHAIGWDLSSRMGLSDLFFHDMPDLLTGSKDNWKNFIYGESGTMTSFLAGNVTNFYSHMQKGEPFQAIASMIPIKQWQDTLKAIELGTTGKMNSIGGQMTKPSAWDAATQFLGIKPASVANAQEKAGAAIEYKNAIKAQKDAIIKDYVSSKDKSRALNRIMQFNKNAPGEAIKVSDLNGLANARVMEEAGVSKDPEINRRTNF